MKIHGINSCDTCRKARRWLGEQGIEATWVDLRADGVVRADLERWLDAVGAEALVNRRSTTWRELPENERPAMEPEAVLPVLEAHPTLIKRPVFERAGEVRVGFTPAVRDWLTA
ncbi:Spx/MgsR family RNA polymerase-binding regulatory protein [Wenzhouxiangella sp. XN79A]|uniref:Spx/MgsR family RNA polymerase-binding regulatory protein n=1 Tax=Wenzhouxiangella sp. XN79A TaxID=2724193 RepID=UPI00144A6A8C|nr:Spx/MgsR family RNA polymerase-binding regulatory protein [Wenzhouxiangella sp. XN79A]NKI35322.1 Spx/MgsR family RNA polymerase-binding regulatory protein [Wenzhouxiangella sp. XN79A]